MAGYKNLGQKAGGMMKSGQAGLPCPAGRLLERASAAIDRATLGHSKAASIPGTPANAAKNRSPK